MPEEPEASPPVDPGPLRRYRPFLITLLAFLLLAALLLIISEGVEYLEPFRYTLF